MAHYILGIKRKKYRSINLHFVFKLNNSQNVTQSKVEYVQTNHLRYVSQREMDL